MNLIIVESPTKARTLTKFLGKDFVIEASMGHVRDLPERKLGVDVDHDFKPEYVISAKKEDTVKRLKDLAKKAEKIILATDPDREGEAIAWHLATLLNSKLETRITFHEITEDAIKKALNHPGKINMDMVDAQQARRILDRLVGYKLSPLLWRKIRKGLSAGRVQSVAVRLIVEKEREIRAFIPKEYWDIDAKFIVGSSEFVAKLKQEVKNKEESDKIVEDLKNAEFKIENIDAKETKRSPYPPFTTSTLQQSASNVFGWSAKKTMQTAQSLYEQGAITYHRTDSTNLAAEAVQAVRQFISKEYGDKYVPAELRLYKTKSKVAQEAHEAIRPTKLTTNHELRTNNRDESRLYELIWKRYVACQMNEAVYKQTGVDVIAQCHPGLDPGSLMIDSGSEAGMTKNYALRANGLSVVFDGWKKLYGRDDDDTENKLPELTVGQILKLLELIPSQHFTTAPPRFTEASLIKTLEEYGIGRPSTYAPIISTIQDRQYVEKIDKKFQPTSLGMAVNDFLIENFKTIMDYQFTAQMEDQLDEVANGEKKWVPVLKEFYTPFAKILDSVQETAKRVQVEVETTDEICPKCGSPVVVRLGKFGKFFACSRFPDCKYTSNYVQKINIKCPKCKTGDIIVRKTKSKRTFYGCSNYPNCDFASWTKPT